MVLSLRNEIPKVSIAIVNWNTNDLLEKCLTSIFAETTCFPIEVIVADNGSNDGSCQMVEKKFKQVKLIKNTSNLGFARGTNQCFELAKGKYILMLNSDTVILDRAIEKTVAFADANQDTAAIGCRLIFPNGKFQNSCFRIPNFYGMILESLWLSQLFKSNYFLNWNRYGGHDQYWTTPKDVDCVMGSYVLLRGAVLQDVGYLDMDFFMYGEETDLFYRIKKKGFKILYYPDATIMHVHSGSRKTEADKAWSYCANVRGILYFLYKWKRLTAYFGNILITLFTFPRIVFWTIMDFVDSIKFGKFKKSRLLNTANLPFHIKAIFIPRTMAERWGKNENCIIDWRRK